MNEQVVDEVADGMAVEVVDAPLDTPAPAEVEKKWRLTKDEFRSLASGSKISDDLLQAAYLVLVGDYDTGAAARATSIDRGRTVPASQVSRALKALRARALNRDAAIIGVDAAMAAWLKESVVSGKNKEGAIAARELRADLAAWIVVREVTKPTAAGVRTPVTVGPSQFGSFMRRKGFIPYLDAGETMYPGLMLKDPDRAQAVLTAKHQATTEDAKRAVSEARASASEL